MAFALLAAASGNRALRSALLANAAGKLIGVWTVDDPFALAWSRARPVNAIYTNKPREIRP